jgi:hypothetical protein
MSFILIPFPTANPLCVFRLAFITAFPWSARTRTAKHKVEPAIQTLPDHTPIVPNWYEISAPADSPGPNSGRNIQSVYDMSGDRMQPQSLRPRLLQLPLFAYLRRRVRHHSPFNGTRRQCVQSRGTRTSHTRPTRDAKRETKPRIRPSAQNGSETILCGHADIANPSSW